MRHPFEIKKHKKWQFVFDLFDDYAVYNRVRFLFGFFRIHTYPKKEGFSKKHYHGFFIDTTFHNPFIFK